MKHEPPSLVGFLLGAFLVLGLPLMLVALALAWVFR